MPTPEEFRDQFNEGWQDWLERHFEEEDAPSVVPRTGHPGQPLRPRSRFPDPKFGEDPNYIPPDQLPEGNVSPEYDTLTGFLFGQEWLFVTSSWVHAIQYHDTNQDLTVEFHNGAVCQYPGITVDEAMDFATAPSKGRWIHQHLIPRNDYVLLSVGGPVHMPEAKAPRGYEPRQINRFTMRPKGTSKKSYKPGSMGKGPQRF